MKVQKSTLPTLFNFARVRVASQPHVNNIVKYTLGSYLTHYSKKNRAMQRARADGQISELKARISNLQQELDNSVAVQTDFVRLSQSLQMELEKIRQSEKEV